MTAGYFSPQTETPSVDPDQLDEHRIEDAEADIDVENLGPQRAYFQRITTEAHRCFEIAKQARRRGFDPELKPEIPFAEDLASRVEALVGPEGIAERIRELSEELDRENLALTVSKEIAEGRFGEHEGPEDALDQAIRTGLAILTEGILVAPLEGVAEVKVRENPDGSRYADVYFAGPIRAAGGTGQALSVLIADVVRRELGLDAWQATKAEAERFKEEIPAYKRAQNLQYTPPPDEIEAITANLPIGVNGEGTESEEVSGQRDLPRVETNQLRGGACLVMAEGLTLKAPKILKHVDHLGLEGWGFLDALVQGDDDAGGEDEEQTKTEIKPNKKFIKELTAGRPVFSHPMATGGFRLRYGRVRNAGLAATAIHPALTVLVDDFLAVGTQLKVERPGKGTIVTPCDEIEPPIVRLDDDSVVEVHSVEQARSLVGRIEEIIDLGEMLVPFGEFLENNKPLAQSAWCQQWWAKLLEDKGKELPEVRDAQPALAFAVAEDTDTPLHPRFTLFWHDLEASHVRQLADAMKEAHLEEGRLSLPLEDATKNVIEALGATHEVTEERILVTARCSLPVLRGAGYRAGEHGLEQARQPPTDAEDALALAEHLSGVPLMPKAPCRIGARMGRPEKAAEREMSPLVHGLVPLGNAGGLQRLIGDAAQKGTIGATGEDAFRAIEAGQRACTDCGEETLHLDCPECGARTRPTGERPKPSEIPLGDLVDEALERLELTKLPDTVKGVKGLTSEDQLPEPVEKAILRAKHDVSVFKDGTCRHDMTDIPLTQFRPQEIGTPVEELRELGYTEDVNGQPLAEADQLVPMRVQDIVVNEDALAYMARVADFVDDLLTRLYGIEPYYDLEEPRDLVGHLAVGLAPHTSGGVLCRIIGTTKAAGHFAHPFFHAAKRRNADGDEDCIMLLMDGLLNFSRSYLPRSRGGQMDAPLTLSIRVDPTEIDGEAHNIETVEEYPLAFFEATREHPDPKQVLEHVEIVEDRLGTPEQYAELAATHDTARFDEGPALSAYKTIDTMSEKMDGQLSLAERLRAVDAGDVASRVICDHFMPDIIGNLKAFSRQTVRCAKCNSKYRRVPLSGRCRKCKNKLTMTVHEASVKKYIDVARKVAENYAVDAYTQQRLNLVEEAIESLFENDKVEKAQLTDFM